MTSDPRVAGAADLIPGYRILSLIGRGGMGAVYRAVKVSIGKEVALKVLLPSVAEDSVTAARFDREVRALARVRHPGLVNVLDAGSHGPYRYLVMDLVDGVDLQAAVERDGPLSADLLQAVALQVLDALDYVHRHGMVHRDLKPANLILGPDGRVLLCDLGLVRIADEDSQLTQRLMLGTPEYVSPEQVEGASDLDIRSDLYSLGAMLYFLWAGRSPFAGDTPMATAQKHLHAQPPSLLAIRPGLPRRLAALIARLMARQRDKRLQTPAKARLFLDLFNENERRRSRLTLAASFLPLLVLGVLALARFLPPAGPDAVGVELAKLIVETETDIRECRRLLSSLSTAGTIRERRRIERLLNAAESRYRRLKQRITGAGGGR